MNDPASDERALPLVDALNARLRAAFAAVCGAGIDAAQVVAVPAAQAAFGDFQCNAAMALARARKQSPRELAQAVAAELADPAMWACIEVAGPGFINLTLTDAWVCDRLVRQAADARLGVPAAGAGRTVVLDYGSPNITKPLHIGHLRSHNIGSVLDRLLRALDYRVVADNHLGDWGTQFGITIAGWRAFGDEAALARSPLAELERVYVQSYGRGKEDPAWKDHCRAELVKLQAGDPETLVLWKRFVAYSLQELDRIYARLGVRYDLVRGESHYHEKLAPTIAALEAAGLARASEGALVVFLEEEGLPPCIVRKSDGGFNYAASDLATVDSRVHEFAPERIVYVTDERQQLHFRQVFAISRRRGIRVGLEHVWFGLMRLPEGTFATRDGNVIPLDRLLDDAEARALEVVRTASPDMEPERQRDVARMVGIGAVKYADLSQNPQSVVTFTWEKALALHGNSAPYLQYAYARIRSVLDKHAERFPGVDPLQAPLQLALPQERALAVRLLQYPETVVRAAETYRPNALCDYLYALAGDYSTLYQNVPFLKADPGVRESRVRLCAVTAHILRAGLDLLGIATPERI